MIQLHCKIQEQDLFTNQKIQNNPRILGNTTKKAGKAINLNPRTKIFHF